MDRPKRATRNQNPNYRDLAGIGRRGRRPFESEEHQNSAQLCGNDISSERPTPALCTLPGNASASTVVKRDTSEKSQGSQKKKVSRMIEVSKALEESVEAFRLMDEMDSAKRVQDEKEDDGPPILEDMRLTTPADYPQKQALVVSSPGSSDDKASNATPDCSIDTGAMSMNEADVKLPVLVPENNCGLKSGDDTSISSSTTVIEVLTEASVKLQAYVESKEATLEANVGISDVKFADPAEVKVEPPEAVAAPAEMKVEPAQAVVEPAEVDVELAKTNRKKKSRVRVLPQIIELYKMLEAQARDNGNGPV